jgi:8-oxo-dGTP pyrophosphatase MutT (NUDIX family)
MTQRIDVTVAAVIETDDRFLVVEEKAGGKIVYNQPAGHLEPGESLIAAVIRETYEETGFSFEPDGVLGLYLWHCDEADTSFLRIAFCGDAVPPTTDPTLDEGILATHWLTRSQLIAREARLRSPLVLRCLDDYRAGIRHPISMVSELPADELMRLVGA